MFSDLPYDLQYEILRRASELQTFCFTKRRKRIRHSNKHNSFYHSHDYYDTTYAPGLLIRNGEYLLFAANNELIAKLEHLSRIYAKHGKVLHFFFKTPRTWSNMPPVNRRVLKESSTSTVFNVLFQNSYQHLIFADTHHFFTKIPDPSSLEDADDTEIDMSNVIRRMFDVGLATDRVLVNNILVDLFYQNGFSIDTICKSTNEEALNYLAWILWWHGNWDWNIRHNDFKSLFLKFSPSKNEFHHRDKHKLGLAIAGLLS